MSPAARKLRVAVVGLGRAGRARVRALDGHPRAELVCVARREPGPGERHLFELVEGPDVDAVIVCTPNLLHAETARACLEARKHVAVEFPLAERASIARELFALARGAERVLHVEHIELLSPSQRTQRERAAALGRPQGGTLAFSADSAGWIGDADLAGTPALRAEARLHRLVDLFGAAEVVAARLDRGAAGYRLELSLAFRDGGAVRLVEERAPGLARRARWAIDCERGPLGDPPPEPPGELFRADLDWFLDRVERGGPSYVADERVLHVLDLVERADALSARSAG